MPSITDYITIAAFLYFFFNGWRKGFLKTLLGPLSLIIGCFAGFAYYQKTQNMAMSLGISILGPFAINILASIVLRLWHKAVNGDIPLSPINRISASALSILWGGSYLALMLLLIGITPLKISWFEKMQNDVLASKSYAFIDRQIGNKMPDTILDVKKITGLLKDPEKLEKFQSTEEFKALSSDELLKDILSDEETAEQIKSQDYGALLANPKIQEVFQNEELLKKIFALNKRIAEELPEEESDPKIIRIEEE